MYDLLIKNASVIDGTGKRAFQADVAVANGKIVLNPEGEAAERFGLKDKGIIADGMDADLLLIDPDTISDRATYQDSLQLCDGIERVIVGGETVYMNKQLTGKTPGKFIPHNRV